MSILGNPRIILIAGGIKNEKICSNDYGNIIGDVRNECNCICRGEQL